MDRKAQLLEFLKASPKDDFLNYALAQEFIAEGNDDKAAEILNQLLNWHPDYVATYYHMGKLLERRSEKEMAMEIYRKGIEIARAKREQHSLAELQSALLELEYE